MKKLFALSALVFLCSCNSDLEKEIKRLKANQEKENKQFAKNDSSIILEKLVDIPATNGIFKITVDSSEYIFATYGESLAIIKHK